MTISEIDKKIKEIQEKAQKKTFRFKKGKKIYKGIPSHLRKFYNDEISRLQKEKLVLLDQETYKIKIDWNDVRFEDSQIRLKISEHYSEPFKFKESRSSFEFLKPYILRQNLNSLSALITGNKIKRINNLTDLQNVINILSIKSEVNHYFKNFEISSIEKIFSSLKNLSNEQLLNFYKLQEKSNYLNYLCAIQSDEYKIIPLTEIFVSKGNSISEDETFLFSVNGLKFNYIIWESTLINRATYIFKTSKDAYCFDIQSLFDFIASNEDMKRRKLRSSINSEDNLFNGVGVINHFDFDQWKVNLNSILL